MDITIIDIIKIVITLISLLDFITFCVLYISFLIWIPFKTKQLSTIILSIIISILFLSYKSLYIPLFCSTIYILNFNYIYI